MNDLTDLKFKTTNDVKKFCCLLANLSLQGNNDLTADKIASLVKLAELQMKIINQQNKGRVQGIEFNQYLNDKESYE